MWLPAQSSIICYFVSNLAFFAVLFLCFAIIHSSLLLLLLLRLKSVCQLMKEGVLAFIIPPDSPPVVRDMLTSYSSHFHIPIVSTQSFSGPSPGVSSRSSFSASISNAARAVADGSSGSGSSATSNLGISTFVPLAEAVAALLRRYKWQQVAYIHDDSAAPDILGKWSSLKVANQLFIQ